MNLIDENNRSNRDNKKIITASIIGIIVLIAVVFILLLVVLRLGNNSVSLTVDNAKYKAQNYLIEKDGVVYIGVEDLSKMIKNEYSYKSGGKDVEDDNQCYVTNYGESTFFEVGSNVIYKELSDSESVEYYTLEKPIIKENGKIYMPISASSVAMNTKFSNEKNKYVITSIGYLESYYNKQKSNSFIPDSSIVWDVSYSNKKLLKLGLVITNDAEGSLGVSKVSASSNKKSKVVQVTTSPVINPKYDDIEFVERYNQLIVTKDDKKGIIQLTENNGNFSVKTIVEIQYDDIGTINENLFWISEVDSDKNVKYGVIDISKGTEEVVLPVEYEDIGINISEFRNNGLDNRFLVYDNLIPVKKNNLWGFVDKSGNVAIPIEYTGLGCEGTNANSNVLLIPEKNAIVVNKDNKYGVINKTNRVLVKAVTARMYREKVDGKIQYIMIVNNAKRDIIEFIENAEKRTSQPTTTPEANTQEEQQTTTQETDNQESQTTETQETEKNETAEN